MSTPPQSPPDDDDFLTTELEAAQWSWINPHANRDRVILIAPSLDISQAAQAMAQNDQISVQNWISSGLISKPSLSQLEVWRAEPNKVFKIRIVQPWVLVQEILQ